MEPIHTTIVFEEAYVASSREPATSVGTESMENPLDHYDEPGYFFKGAIFGLICCVPLWIVIFWLIT